MPILVNPPSETLFKTFLTRSTSRVKAMVMAIQEHLAERASNPETPD